MTIDQRKIALEGRDYWGQYVRINGYAFRPTPNGLRSLSKNIDISIAHLSRCITAYLEA
jgi:hypothetical protein